MRARAASIVATVVAVALITGCGDDTTSTPVPATDVTDETAQPEAAPVLPVTVTDATGQQVTVTSIDRIIPVNGDLAEVVFALGLGDHVAATDLSATFPPEADAKPEIGYQRALQAEPILAQEPTVILADELAGPPETLDLLRSAGVAVVVIPRGQTIDGPAAKIRAVGAALGVPGRAEALAADVEADVDSARTEAAASPRRPRVLALYLRGGAVQLAFGEGSGVDALIEAAGGIDVGSELGITDTQPLTAEAVVQAQPDAIIVTTTGLESVGGIEGLLDIAAIERTPAGEGRHIFAYEDQYLYGFGPRIGQLLAELSRDIHSTTPNQ